MTLSEIGFTHDRFAIERKVLNVYGTFDSNKDFQKYLRIDVIDSIGFDTITIIFGSNYYKPYEKTIKEGVCLRVEGTHAVAQNPNDGGSLDFSLVVDSTTIIITIQPFEMELFFVPKLSIRSFLSKVAINPTLKTTIAFVIVQVDNIEKSEGGVFEQLTIADGATPYDQAMIKISYLFRYYKNNLYTHRITH